MNKLPNPKSFKDHIATFIHTQIEEAITDAEVLQSITKTLQDYDSHKEQYQTFKHPEYKREALAIAPLWVWQQATPEAIALFRKLTTYDYRNNTLVIKINNYQDELISYKSRRTTLGKWITAKGTHPNSQCLINVKDNHDHIYVVEGHHDFLTAVLLDISVVMIPTVSYRAFTEYELSILQDRDVILIPDYDKTKVNGVECMQRLAAQVSDVARNAKVFSLPKFVKSENLYAGSDKLDLSEVVELWNDSLSAFTSTLEYRADEGIFYEGELF